jgi:hypothetical protein
VTKFRLSVDLLSDIRCQTGEILICNEQCLGSCSFFVLLFSFSFIFMRKIKKNISYTFQPPNTQDPIQPGQEN